MKKVTRERPFGIFYIIIETLVRVRHTEFDNVWDRQDQPRVVHGHIVHPDGSFRMAIAFAQVRQSRLHDWEVNAERAQAHHIPVAVFLPAAELRCAFERI
jgi:hypothetical protein